ncbi:MAG: glycosyltransferase [Bacilli bacterium]|jgi:glycosyltransferase EpsF|nr:glycosyltransferase [Bacilli bacterium]
MKRENATEKPRVLLVFAGKMVLGGIEFSILNNLRNFDHSAITVDILERSKEKGMFDDEIESFGGKVLLDSDEDDSFFGHAKKMKQIFKKGNYSIVYFHTDCFDSTDVFLSFLFGVRCRILHSHNNADPFLKKRRRIKMFVNSFCTNYHFADSKEAGEWLFGKRQFTVLKPSIDLGKFVFSKENREFVRKSYGIADDAFVVGCIGHFVPLHKNQSFLIDVFREIVAKKPNSYLVFVGEGPEKEELVEKAKQTSDHILFIGNSIHIPTSFFYSAFDVFCLPSFHEGLPLVVMEAVANGLYCVNSTNVPLDQALNKEIFRLALSDGVTKWAKTIIDVGMLGRQSTGFDNLLSNGYDAKDSANRLQAFCLGLSKKKR